MLNLYFYLEFDVTINCILSHIMSNFFGAWPHWSRGTIFYQIHQWIIKIVSISMCECLHLNI